MELLVTVDDYCVKKIIATASFAQVSVNVQKIESEEELVKIYPQAKSIALRTDAGFITQHIAILKYISKLASPPCLLSGGDSAFDVAAIDQWLQFSWNDLEVALQLFYALSSGLPEYQLSSEDKSAAEFKAAQDISKSLATLENHLSSRTFLVNETVTVADISLACTVCAISDRHLFHKSAYPSVFRWLMTCFHHPKLKPVLGDHILPTSSPSSSSTSTTNRVSTGISKWQRGRIRVKELLNMGESAIGKEVIVKGWIRTARKGNDSFVELTDGSTVKGIQLVLSTGRTLGKDAVDNCGGVGASLSVKGNVVASPARGQTVEIHATVAEVLGPMYAGDNGEVGGKHYPMAKKAHTVEFLREKAHLRPRTKVGRHLI